MIRRMEARIARRVMYEYKNQTPICDHAENRNPKVFFVTYVIKYAAIAPNLLSLF